MLTAFRERSQSKYNEERHRAELSAMRAALEHSISNMNMQLMATEQRWRDVNHLLISAQDAQATHAPEQRAAVTSFIRELGISDEEAVVDPKLIFVLTPFADEEEATYQAIKEVCDRTGFTCMRGDEQYVSGDLLRHIVRLIARARVVIANVGTRNPNVFYELGIAQAIGKQTILVSRTIEELPFDLRSQQIVLFHEPQQLSTRLAESLVRTIHASA